MVLIDKRLNLRLYAGSEGIFIQKTSKNIDATKSEN